MIDLILRNARIAGQDTLTDLGVDQGVLTTSARIQPRRRSSTWPAGW